MINYTVGWEKDGSGLVVVGAFNPHSKVIEIPRTDPDRNRFVDLFLHKADIDIGLSYLDHITADNELIINESLFIVGLNSCMKCFKQSKARKKLDKTKIFSDDAELFELFKRYEIMRDKHYILSLFVIKPLLVQTLLKISHHQAAFSIPFSTEMQPLDIFWNDEFSS